MAIVPVLIALLLRRWVALAAAGCVAVALAAMVLPRALGSGSDSDGPALRVMSVNLHAGRADATEVVELASRRQVDLLAVQELTPGAVSVLRDAGLEDLLPQDVLAVHPGASGSGIYARHPLTEMPDPMADTTPFEMARGRLSHPRLGPVEVVSVHPRPPISSVAIEDWRRALGTLPRADSGGPLRVLIGDFNATLDHTELREIVDTGYVDAAEAVGDGLAPSWPRDGRWTLPVTIDHVLADRRLEVAGYEMSDVDGTDHRSLFAELVGP